MADQVHIVNGQTVFPYGPFRGTVISNIPAAYLLKELYLIHLQIFTDLIHYPEIKEFIENSHEILQQEILNQPT